MPSLKKKNSNKKNSNKKNKNKTFKIYKQLILKKQTKRKSFFKPFQKDFEKQLSKSLVKSNNEFKKKIATQLLQKFSPINLSPKNNFYNYINHKWLKKVSLNDKQKYIVQVDDFRLVQDRVYRQLDEIIIAYIKNNNNKLSQNLKQFRLSVINMNSKSYSKQLAKEIVEKIDELRKDKNNLWKLLAMINSDEMIASAAPFTWSMNPDPKEPTKFRCHLSPHTFVLLDLHVYYDDGNDREYKKKYVHEFNKHCKELFDTLLGNHNFDTNSIHKVEVDIFNAMGCDDVIRTEKEYNKITANECFEKFGFNWKEFCKELGFKKTPNSILTTSLNYLKCGTDLMVNKWNSEEWRPYWIWIFLRQIARLTKDWEKITYKFHGNFQRGQEKINYSDAVSTSLYLSVPFNTFLTNQYVNKYKDDRIIEYTNTLCTDLKIVFERIIKRNKWMSPKTKKYALLKLNHVNFAIGHMNELREDPLLGYNNNLYDNMKKIMNWRHKRFIDLEGDKVIDIQMMDWNQYPVKMT